MIERTDGLRGAAAAANSATARRMSIKVRTRRQSNPAIAQASAPKSEFTDLEERFFNSEAREIREAREAVEAGFARPAIHKDGRGVQVFSAAIGWLRTHAVTLKLIRRA